MDKINYYRVSLDKFHQTKDSSYITTRYIEKHVESKVLSYSM